MLTPDQVQQARTQLGWGTSGSKSTSQSDTWDTVMPRLQSLTGQSSGQPMSDTSDPLKQPPTPFMESPAGHAVTAVKDSVTSLPGKLSQDVQAGAADVNKGGTWNILKGLAKGAGRTAGDVASTVFSPISASLGAVGESTGLTKGLTGAAQYIVDKTGLADSKELQDFATKHPNAEEDFNRIMNLVAANGVKGDLMKIPETLKTGAQNVASTVKDMGQGLADTTKQTVADLKSKVSDVKPAMQEKLVQNAKDNWAKPTTVNKPGYSKATDIYKNATSKGHDIAQTLVDNKINLSDNIHEGKYNTSDTADKIRSDTAKTSTELLRPSLEKADLTTPKTPVAEVIQKTMDELQKNKYMTQEEKNTVLQKLETSKKALEQQYKDGMSLTDIHDEKILRGQKSGFSPVGDVETNLEAQKNNALRDALKTTLEEKAPKDIPVKEFNKELSKQYKAADYLDSLHGKNVPQSLVSKVAKYGAKVVGASLGSVGVLPGEFAGYHLGGLVENMMNGLPGKVRDSLLGNLEKTNPEAFKAVQGYLQK